MFLDLFTFNTLSFQTQIFKIDSINYDLYEDINYQLSKEISSADHDLTSKEKQSMIKRRRTVTEGK